jgi:hypothetical protein
MKPTPFRISAKQLGQFGLSDFCQRCFWIKLKCGGKLPYQTPVPGVFSSLDALTKRISKSHFEKHGQIPRWLDGFGDLGNPIPVPHHSRFFIVDTATGIKLTGVPDQIFQRADDSLFIIDNKTARWTANQERILPLYAIQVNVYGYLAQSTDMGRVSGLGLVYYQPQTDVDDGNIDSIATTEDFAVRFVPKLVPVPLGMERIPNLLQRVREIADATVAPEGRKDCVDCGLLEKLVGVAA